MADSDFLGKVTAVIQTSRGLMSSAHCNRFKIADKPLYYKDMDFFFSINCS